MLGYSLFGYSLAQWALFFYFYCFCGWIWESCFVSVREKHWVNRGFLHGPVIPIYGTGAVSVLFLAAPVQQYVVLVYLVGAAGATVLEYVTGSVMEKLFKVRYWDYSEKRFNLNGHICLGATVLWGFFSILMTYVCHRPVAEAVGKIPEEMTAYLAVAFTVVFSGDTMLSVREALDLRELLKDITQNSQEILRLQKRMEVILAFLSEDTERLRSKVSESIDAGLDTIGQTRVAQGVGKLKDAVKPDSGRMLAELEKLKGELERVKETKLPGTNQMYRQALRILKRNPQAISATYKKALDEIKGHIFGNEA